MIDKLIKTDPLPVTLETNVESVLGLYLDMGLLRIPVVDNTRKFCGVIRLNQDILFKIQSNGGKAKEYLDSKYSTIYLNDSIESIDWKKETYLPVIAADGMYQGYVVKEDATNFIHNYERILLTAIRDKDITGIVAINQSNCITFVNRSAEKLYGLNNIKGKLITEVNPQTMLHNIIKSGNSLFSITMMLPNGTQVLADFHPLYENDGVIGAIAFFNSIDEIDEVLKKSHQVMEIALNSSYDGIWITDNNGKAIYINDAIERITGLRKNECIGRYSQDLEREGILSESVALKVMKEKDIVTILQATPSGKKTLVTGTPIYSEDHEISFVVVNNRDITELTALRENYQKSQILKAELENLKTKLKRYEEKEIITKSKQMRKILDLVEKIAPLDSTVLIYGESGVGKEVIAKLLHNLSPRSKNGRYVSINCGAIPSTLLESELFGYEKGAFTGAIKEGKLGLMEQAHNGTLLLDEIGELPMDMQVKLLRVLQERKIVRLGGTNEKELDLRIIACSNRDLHEMTQQHLFREDLFYRLNIVPITIPPLRERTEDISGLLLYYLDHFNKKFKTAKYFSPAVIDLFVRHSWPGNVRQLINIVERLVITSQGDLIGLTDLPTEFLGPVYRQETFEEIIMDDGKTLKQMVGEFESKIVENAMREFGTSRKAASVLGISQASVLRRIKRNH